MFKQMSLVLLFSIYTFTGIFWTTEIWGLEKTRYIKLGGKNGWHGLYLDKSQFEESNQGYQQISLSQGEYFMHPAIDLLVHFNGHNNQTWNPVIGNYEILNKDFLFNQKNKIFGTSSGEWKYLDNILILKPNAQSIFHKNESLVHFSIEFWIYPYSKMDEQYIIQMKAPFIHGKTYQFEQNLSAKVKNQRIQWTFENIFLPALGEIDISKINKIVVESGEAPIHQWSHQAISFNAFTGTLSSYTNGKEQTTKKVVNTNNLKDTLILRFIQDSAFILTIGENYLGLIDELSISFLPKHGLENYIWTPILNKKLEYSEFQIHPYLLNGKVVSQIYDLKSNIAYLKHVKTTINLPDKTHISFQYRIHDHPFILSADKKNNPEWKELKLNQDLSNQPDLIQGRYFQWQAILQTQQGIHSPIINDVEFEFIVNEKPSTPKHLVAFEKNGKIALKWKSPLDINIKGYRIYYGLKSKNYFLPDVPIAISVNELAYPLVPVYILSKNFKENQQYFFSITAISIDGQESDFSNETSIFFFNQQR